MIVSTMRSTSFPGEKIIVSDSGDLLATVNATCYPALLCYYGGALHGHVRQVFGDAKECHAQFGDNMHVTHPDHYRRAI